MHRLRLYAIGFEGVHPLRMTELFVVAIHVYITNIHNVLFTTPLVEFYDCKSPTAIGSRASQVSGLRAVIYLEARIERFGDGSKD